MSTYHDLLAFMRQIKNLDDARAALLNMGEERPAKIVERAIRVLRKREARLAHLHLRACEGHYRVGAEPRR